MAKKPSKKTNASKTASKATSKATSKVASVAPSGTATPAVVEKKKPVVTYLGVNFGQSFSSIAVLDKEGLPDCIANDDGERQIASIISFAGEQEYYGAPAKQQLVRNAANTIVGFRNLLGKSYADVKDVVQPYNSAPIINIDGQPGFRVQVEGGEKTLTAHECAVRFLRVLLSYATDFLGRPITHAVLSLPDDFSPAQTAAAAAAAVDAGIPVIQTITDTGAVLTAYEAAQRLPADGTLLVVDAGASTTAVAAVAVRAGLYAPLAVAHDASGGDALDAALMDWFFKEFTKKTKVAVAAGDHRAHQKLRLAVETTKKSLSASNTAPCSVESLADGLDFHGTVNRTRANLLFSAPLARVADAARRALDAAGVDPTRVAGVILAGGSSALPVLGDKVLALLPEEVELIGGIEPTEAIAKGAVWAAAQAVAAEGDVESDAPLAAHAAALAAPNVTAPPRTAAPLGVVSGEAFFTLLPESTPLPARRAVQLAVPEGASSVLISLHEGAHSVNVETLPVDEPEEDEEPEEPEEVRTAVVSPARHIADVVVPVTSAAPVDVSVIVDATGTLTVSAQQAGGEKVKVVV